MHRTASVLFLLGSCVTLACAASCSLLVDWSNLSRGGGDAAGDDAPPASDSGALGAGPSADAEAGPLDASGGRVTRGLVALYTFHENAGTTVHDVSGVPPALDATIDLLGGTGAAFDPQGITITAPAFVRSSSATKIISGWMASHEATVEAWATPRNTTQGISRIAGVGGNFGDVDLVLTQNTTWYESTIRAPNGNTELASPQGSLTTKRTHVVTTRRADGVRILYVDGVEAVRDDGSADPSGWSTEFGVTIANTVSLDGAFLGAIHLVAFYTRALDPAEVAQNFAAGSGH